MINSINLNNFQNHKSINLEFEEGINVISGSSGAGKSAIVKALNWVINGEPNGNSIINYNEKECKVAIEIDNNKIEKIKSDKLNQYVINNKELNSVGQSVPEEVKQLTNFNELNLQMQFDKFFLLQDTPGEVARKLNKFIDLEIIDKIRKKTNSKVNKQKQNIDNLESNILEIKTKLKKYKNLDNIEKIVILLEEIDELKKTYIEQNNNLIKYKIELEVYKKELNQYKNIDKQKVILKKLNKLKNSYELYNNKIQQIKVLKNEYKNNKIELDKFKDNNSKKELVNKLENLLDEYWDRALFLSILTEFKENKFQIKDLQNKIYNISRMKDNLLPKGSLCPVCKKMI